MLVQDSVPKGPPLRGGDRNSPSSRHTLLMTKRNPLRPYRRPMPRVLGVSYGGGRFLTGEVPLWCRCSRFDATPDTLSVFRSDESVFRLNVEWMSRSRPLAW